MKRSIASLAVVATSALTFLSTPTATAATTTYQERFSGYSLYGISETSEPCSETGWISHETLVNVFTTKTSKTVFYSSYQGDECADTQSYSSGSGEAAEFDVDGRLSAAHVVASVPIWTQTYHQGVPAAEVQSTLELDLTWTATGPLSKSLYTSTSRSPGVYNYSYKFNGQSRPAAVTGTLDLSGSIQSASSATLQVSHE
jgi:hypothetical protein